MTERAAVHADAVRDLPGRVTARPWPRELLRAARRRFPDALIRYVLDPRGELQIHLTGKLTELISCCPVCVRLLAALVTRLHRRRFDGNPTVAADVMHPVTELNS